MVIKELAAKQVAKQLLPLVGEISDKNLGGFLSLARMAAPNEFTKSFIDAINCPDGHDQTGTEP